MAMTDMGVPVIAPGNYPALQAIAMGANPAAPENLVRSIRNAVTADVQALATNSPLVANAIATSAVYMGGPNGLRPAPRLDPARLNLTPAQAEDLENQLEQAFVSWAGTPSECDSLGQDTWPTMVDTALRRSFVTGEALVSWDWSPQWGGEWATKARLVEPQRISRSMDIIHTPEGHFLRNGLETDKRGKLVAVHLDPRIAFPRVDGPAAYMQPGVRHEVETAWGRPLVTLALLDRPAPGVGRGVSPLGAAVARALQLDDLANGTVKQLLAQSEIAWTLVSNMTPEEAVKGFDGHNHGVPGTEVNKHAALIERLNFMNEWFTANRLNLSSAVSLLPEGSKLEAVQSSAELRGFEYLNRRLLTELAAAFGQSYSSFVGDYSQDSYSSAKMSNIGMWTLLTRRRNSLVVPLYAAAYACIAEEAIMSGRIILPKRALDFYQNRGAYLTVDWQGMQRPAVDELKTAQAAQIELQTGVASLASIAAERGQDWRDIAKQRATERAFYEKLGLPYPLDNPAPAAEIAPPDDKEVTK
ncbi:MAG: phage portal protein [Ancalomicrobiaceae bacterium]|nr:phage portal protein [Ancalomicrobiaceae bacterium]